MKRLFFVRHGLSHQNVAGGFSGRSDTPLTEEGKRQAAHTGKQAKNTLPPIDVIISSPLKRAHNTAELIAEQLGYPLDRIEQNPLFIERDFGVLEGTLAEEFFKTHTSQDMDTVENVETIEQLHQRAETALQYLEARPEDNILVVGHGSFGRALKRVVQKRPHSEEYTHRKFIDNAEIVELI